MGTPVSIDGGLLGVNMPFDNCVSFGDESMQFIYDSDTDVVTATNYPNGDCSGSGEAEEIPVSSSPLCTSDEDGAYAYYQFTSSPYVPAGSMSYTFYTNQDGCNDADVDELNFIGTYVNPVCASAEDGTYFTQSVSDTDWVLCGLYSNDVCTTPSGTVGCESYSSCSDEAFVYLNAYVAFSSVAATSSDDDDVCFSGSETVLLDSGVTVAMEEVKVGMNIQVATFDGSLTFAEVIFLPHERNSQASVFIELETANGSLKVTPTHLVMAGECGGEMSLRYAEDVTVGTCMASVYGDEVVTSSGKTYSNGVYSVVTAHPDGIVVVNGFKASSFALNHAVGNAYYHIHRTLYAVAPTMVNALSTFGLFLGSIAFSVAST